MSDVEGAQEAPEDTIGNRSPEEVKARRLGWVSKDEFKGDPEHWRPAEEFLERGEKILPIALRNNDRLQRRLDSLENELRETKDSARELVDYTAKSEQRAYERAKRELEAKIEQATANADVNAARGAMQELDALTKDHAPAPKKVEQPKSDIKIDPEIQDWIGRETWFNRDRALNGYAIDAYDQLQRDKPGLTQTELLAEVKRRTVAKFPEKFGINPEREGAAMVASPSGGSAPKRNGKSYENLPAEAKKACDKFVRDIPGYTKEKYVADYDWDA